MKWQRLCFIEIYIIVSMFQSEARCPVCLHVSGVSGAARVAVNAAPHEAHLCCEFGSIITCI